MGKTKRTIKNVTPVIINEEEMFLKYNVLSIKKMEELGIDLTKLNENLSITDLGKILYCGLITYDPSLTVDEVLSLIDIGDMEYLAGKITEAMNSVKKGKN